MTGPAAPPPGWLLDPDDPSLLRWWDGRGWSEFRQPRTTPPAPPGAVPPAAAEPAPPLAPERAAVDEIPAPTWSPRPLPPPGPSPAPAPAPGTAPPAGRPPFWSQFDDVVLAVTGSLPPETARRRQAAAAGARARVVDAAAPGERVLRVLPVAVHDLHRSGERAGTRLFAADLVATDHRLLLWADETDPELAVIEVDLADVVGARDLPGPAAVLYLEGDGQPLVLSADDPGRRAELLDLLHRIVVPHPR